MENKTKPETERWVEERMALLAAPDDWEPDAAVAHARLQGRLSERRPTLARSWILRMATVILACLVLFFATPAARVMTQQFRQWLTMRKIEVVQADFSKLRGIWLVPQVGVEKEIPAGGELPHPPPNLDFKEAARRAGFTPRLPHEGLPSSAPNFMAFDQMVWSTTIKVADLEASLRQAGVNDQPIPQEWDGVRVSLHVGAAISAAWPGGEMALMQHPSITLSAPGGFDIAEYWTAALRAAGVNRDQAQRLAERMRTAPTILLGIGTKSRVAIREVRLRTGPATLIEKIGETGNGRPVLLIWSVEDRVYHLVARNAGLAVVIANSIE